MHVYTLPTIQGNTARKGPSQEFQPPVSTFLSCAYRLGGAAASLFWLPVLSHGYRQIHQLVWSTPSDITTEAVAKAFVSVCIARFGCPQKITTDQGRQFEACLFKTLDTIFGSSLTWTTAWHPASNGMIERLHRQLKAVFMCHADEHWAKALLLVLLGIRSAWKEDLKASCVWFSPAVTRGILRSFPRQTHWHHRLRVLTEGPHWKALAHTSIPACCDIHVHFQGPGHRLTRIFTAWCPLEALQAPYVRKYRVLHRGNKTYSIDVQGAAKTVSIDHLRPAYVLHVNTQSASPPAIPSSTMTRSGQWVCFPDYLGVQWSKEGGGVAYPCSQNILSSIHHYLINIDRVASVSGNWKVA